MGNDSNWYTGQCGGNVSYWARIIKMRDSWFYVVEKLYPERQYSQDTAQVKLGSYLVNLYAFVLQEPETV